MIRPFHLQIGFRFLSHRFRRLHPFEVQVQLLNVCDRLCLYCRCPQVETSILTTDQWRVIIRSLGQMGTLRIKFQGGEPTIRPDFQEICAEAKQAGMRTATVSHGGRIAAQPKLLDYLDELVVSLDSTRPDVNDMLRGEGAHWAALKAIDLALERGLKSYVNMAVCKPNFSDVKLMLDFCEGRGILMNAQPIIFGRTYYEDEAKPIGLSSDEIRSLHRQLAEWKRQGRNLLFSSEAYLKAVYWPYLPELTTRSDGETTCRAGKDYIHIEPNGDVLPCIQHGADFRSKNIIRDGLEEALGQAQHHNCADCWPAYLNERKLLFRLRPRALRDMIRRS
jgi:MoaA/NifB/PqqE/SkfB family radical SAM enzyme